MIDTVVLYGQGGRGEMKFSTRRSGSQTPLMFEMTEKHLKHCDTSQYTNVLSNNNINILYLIFSPLSLTIILSTKYQFLSPANEVGRGILSAATSIYFMFLY